MLVLGIESSCDETGIALYDTELGLLSHAIYSQVAMHAEYGGVVPELASRDHIRRVLPLTQQILDESGKTLQDLDAIAYTKGPGLAGALLVGASIGCALAFTLKIPTLGVHHLEGHLLSPLISDTPPVFPFVALLVSGGHTQLMQVSGVGQYVLLGETLDDAAGEAFDKTAKLLGLGYPGGPALSEIAGKGQPKRFKLPRPMLHSGDLNFSFSGLKTAVLTMVNKQTLDEQTKADIALAFQEAMVEVLIVKAMGAMEKTGLDQLVVAGGVGANRQLREQLTQTARKKGVKVFYPKLEFCTDNGAMIAYAGAMRLKHAPAGEPCFTVKPRWDMEMLTTPNSTEG